jgi:FtsZ-binding cell division protein ZapB
MARELTLTELERERDRIVEEMRRLGVKPPEDRVAELEAKVTGLRDALRRAELLAKEVEDLKEALRKREIEAAEYRRRIEELRREIEEARKVPWERVLVPPRPKPAPPRPVPVPARPPAVAPPVARVLPPIPETCPVCGAPLKEVTRVPLIVKDPVLTPEEEYLRARLGLPLPTARMEWIDVPVTMKVWQCEGPETHFFERDEAGRLVQRTPEALYRKILTETARLRRITYPPAVPPAYVAAPPPRRITLQDTFRSWLQTVKGMTVDDYMRLTETERSALNREFAEWYRRAAGY